MSLMINDELLLRFRCDSGNSEKAEIFLARLSAISELARKDNDMTAYVVTLERYTFTFRSDIYIPHFHLENIFRYL